MAAETHSRTLPIRLVSSQADGSPGLHSAGLKRGARQCIFTKLSAIRMPDSENVHCLCRESVTSQGMNESADATDAPNPKSTSNEGSAQQSKVLSEVNSEK